jgi:WD40 repeat protein
MKPRFRKLAFLSVALLLPAAVFGQRANTAEVVVFPQLGHSATVNSVVFSPNGKYIASSI